MKSILYIFFNLFFLVQCSNFDVLNKFLYNKKKKKKYNLALNLLDSSKAIKEKFWVIDSGGGTLSLKTANLIKTTAHYQIWLDENDKSFSIDVNEYARELENKIYPVVTSYLGSAADIDKNQKVDILITNSMPKGYGGYVYSLDYTNSQGSNKRDVLYMNSLYSKNKEGFYETTAHELQHLIVNKNLLTNSFKYYIATWINEGTADYISSIVYQPLKYRINCIQKGCINGWSVFDKSFSYSLYSFRYVFMSYLYDNSAANAEGRMDFLHGAMHGKKKDGTKLELRALNAENLFQFFTKYSSRDKKDIALLGTTSKEIFKKLYGSFLLQIDKNIQINDATTRFSDGKVVDFQKISTAYPLPSYFNQLKLPNSKKNIGSPSLLSGQFYYLGKTDVPSSLLQDTISISSRSNSYAILYNFSLNENKDNQIFPHVTSTIQQNNFIQPKQPICMTAHLEKELSFKISKNPDLYKFIKE